MTGKRRKPPREADGIMKVLALNDPMAFATWLFGRRPSKVEPIDPGLAVVTKRIGDKLFLGGFEDGERTLLHIEVQLKANPEIGRRMLVCAGLIDRVREASGFEDCVLDQAVIYLDRKEYRDDPGVFVVPKREGKKALVEYQVCTRDDRVPRSPGPGRWIRRRSCGWIRTGWIPSSF